MKQSIILLFCLLVFYCAQAQSVIQVPTVFHVLWNEPDDNIPDSLILQTLLQVNKDFRRQNDDAYLTPDRFLSLAADAEIEFVLATTDPDGNPTDGITRTYTDSSYFYYLTDNMKFDVSGGKDTWLPCAYLNVWIVPELGSGFAVLDGTAKHPGGDEETDGVAIQYVFFDDNGNEEWTILTRLMAQYLDLYYISNPSCLDVDSVADTPVSSWEPLTQPHTCEDTIVTCFNGVDGDMFMNFMSNRFEPCGNMFTLGQKERMRATLNNQRIGLIESGHCGVGIEDRYLYHVDVSPNPTTDFLNFQSTDFGSYSVLDVQGRTLQSGTIQTGKTNLDVSQLPNGIYLLQLRSDKGISTARFVKN